MLKRPIRPKSKTSTTRTLRIVLIYLVVGSLWILFSDRALATLNLDATILTWLQTLKGWFYVFATAFMLYVLIQENFLAIQASMQAQQEAEAQINTVSKLTSDYIYAAVQYPDGKTETLWIAGAVEQITGYTLEEIQARTTDWMSIIHPDDLGQFSRPYSNEQTEKERIYEYRIITKQGEVRWLRDYARVSWQDEPSPKTSIMGAVQDITPQKQAEEALGYRLELEQMITTISTHFINLTPQEAHSKFDRALEVIGYFVHADQSYVYLVSEDRTQLSKTYEWCCAQSLAPTIQEQSYAIPKAVWWKIQLQTSLPFPTELTIPELGNPVTAGLYARGKKTLLTMPMIHANKYIGFLCVEWLSPRKGQIRTDAAVYRTLTDIFTSAIIHQRADMALYRRHREQALLNRVIITASMTSDIEQILQVLCEELTLNFEIPQTIIYFINAIQNTASVIAEYQASGMGSIYGNTILLAHPIISDILAQPRPRFLDSTEVMSLREALDFPPVGTTALLIVPIVIQNQVLGLMFMSSIAPLIFNEEDLELIQSTVAVTERALEATMLQQELREHAQELEHLVDQRTQELRITLQHAQAADRAKSEFVSNVSHELRTPLTNIKLYLDLLNRGQQQRRASYMETIHREADRLQKLIEDLLTLSRLDLGKIEANMESIDLNALIHMLVEDRRPLFTHKGLSLNVHTTQGLPYIYADTKLIEQVLTNLLSNALNYTLSGNVTLTTKIDTIKSQPWITVSVQDTGVGIPAEEQSYLFERFLRGSAGNTTKVGGSGLGLAITKEIVNLHGGHINVESEAGVGSTFTVWLPIGEE